MTLSFSTVGSGSLAAKLKDIVARESEILQCNLVFWALQAYKGRNVVWSMTASIW